MHFVAGLAALASVASLASAMVVRGMPSNIDTSRYDTSSYTAEDYACHGACGNSKKKIREERGDCAGCECDDVQMVNLIKECYRCSVNRPLVQSIYGFAPSSAPAACLADDASSTVITQNNQTTQYTETTQSSDDADDASSTGTTQNPGSVDQQTGNKEHEVDNTDHGENSHVRAKANEMPEHQTMLNKEQADQRPEGEVAKETVEGENYVHMMNVLDKPNEETESKDHFNKDKKDEKDKKEEDAVKVPPASSSAASFTQPAVLAAGFAAAIVLGMM